MPTFKLNKLVRDQIIEKIKDRGGSAEYVVMEGKVYQQALVQKLKEEIRELQDAPLETFEDELADVQEIVYQLCKSAGIDPQTLAKKVVEKRRMAGGFERRLFIKTVTLKDGDAWLLRYREKFEEIPSK